jgi:hypothetical protein
MDDKLTTNTAAASEDGVDSEDNSPFGSASGGESMDIDAAEAAFGKHGDENGPHELGEE